MCTHQCLLFRDITLGSAGGRERTSKTKRRDGGVSRHPEEEVRTKYDHFRLSSQPLIASTHHTLPPSHYRLCWRTIITYIYRNIRKTYT